MNNEVSNSDIMKKIGSIIYKDKVRILIAFVASIASYYFTLYPSDRLSFIVDGIANKEIDFNGVVNEITKIIIVGIALYIVYYFKEYYTLLFWGIIFGLILNGFLRVLKYFFGEVYYIDALVAVFIIINTIYIVRNGIKKSDFTYKNFQNIDIRHGGISLIWLIIIMLVWAMIIYLR